MVYYSRAAQRHLPASRSKIFAKLARCPSMRLALQPLLLSFPFRRERFELPLLRHLAFADCIIGTTPFVVRNKLINLTLPTFLCQEPECRCYPGSAQRHLPTSRYTFFAWLARRPSMRIALNPLFLSFPFRRQRVELPLLRHLEVEGWGLRPGSVRASKKMYWAHPLSMKYGDSGAWVSMSAPQISF